MRVELASGAMSPGQAEVDRYIFPLLAGAFEFVPASGSR